MIQAELTEIFPSVCKMRTEITHCLFCCPGTNKQPMPYVKTQRKSNYLKGSLFMCQHISALHSVLWKSKGCILEAFQMGKLVEVFANFQMSVQVMESTKQGSVSLTQCSLYTDRLCPAFLGLVPASLAFCIACLSPNNLFPLLHIKPILCTQNNPTSKQCCKIKPHHMVQWAL